jgi:hypothetical protein
MSESAATSDLLLSAQFTVSSNFAAPYLFLETSLSGRFDDNAFFLPHGSSRNVTFMAFDETGAFALDQLQQTLTTRTLWQTYSQEYAFSALE